MNINAKIPLTLEKISNIINQTIPNYKINQFIEFTNVILSLCYIEYSKKIIINFF